MLSNEVRLQKALGLRVILITITHHSSLITHYSLLITLARKLNPAEKLITLFS